MSDGLSATIGQGSARMPQNFIMSAGDARILKVTVFDENGDPLPLAGATVVIWKLARTARSTPVVTKELNDGVTIITDAAAAGEANCGRLDVVIDTADSAPLDGEYVHDCRVVPANGAASRIFHGRVFVSPSLS